jgi:hypothetical protein
MSKPARQLVRIAEFPGLASRPDSLDTPPGSAIIQENISSSYEGQLRSRPGIKQVAFEEE